jgi:hypothetical protein
MSATASSPARPIAFALLLLTGASLIGTAVRAQSLADIAKKEEDRRKTVPAASKVYTNKDLNPSPPGSEPPAAAAATPSKPAEDAAKTADGDGKPTASKPGDAGDKGPIKDQAYWATRLKTLQDAASRDQNYADAMQTRINALTTDFVNRDDPAQRAVIERDRQKAVGEFNRLKGAIEADKKAIADLEEEARRAGVPPGWLR